VAEAYLAQGHEVVVLDNLSTGSRANVPEGVRLVEADIRDRSLGDVFAEERPDVVNHQAALASVRDSMREPVLYAEVNVLGSVNLLECCRRHGVHKVIYASTGGAVYGEPQSLPVSEDHPVNPLDPYGASKHHVEHYLYLYCANYGLSYTVLRYPNVYGPRQDPYGEAGVIAIFINQMLDGGRPVINGTGEQVRDFVYVGDVARANVLALDHGDGDIYNLGTGQGTSVNQVFELLNQQTGYLEPAVHGPPKLGEVFAIYLDASRARDELGWTPRETLSDGLLATVTWFREQRLLQGEPGIQAHHGKAGDRWG
jgi:UDP-glucose 4-epimerase